MWKPLSKNKIKFSLYGIVGLILLSLGIGAGFSGCANLHLEASERQQRFAANGLELPRFYDVETHPGVIHMASVEETREPSIVFVHGSPGSWDNFIGFLADTQLRTHARIVSVDRPGFGESGPEKAVPSIEEQARRIHKALTESGIEGNAVLVGHSLGGPVVARIAVDYPDFVKGLVLVAPSMDPDLEKRKWFNYAAKIPPLKWALSSEWANSNDEIFPHKKELIQLAKRLPEIRAPVIVIQGMQDRLVPPENADFVERMIPNAASIDIWRIPDLNHFIPWVRPDLISKAALRLLGGQAE